MLPVKSKWSKDKLLNAAATSGPPVITAASEASKNSLNIFSVRSEVAGVNSDGLIITLFPAAKMVPRGDKTRLIGKFHGLIKPTVPKG